MLVLFLILPTLQMARANSGDDEESEEEAAEEILVWRLPSAEKDRMPASAEPKPKKIEDNSSQIAMEPEEPTQVVTKSKARLRAPSDAEEQIEQQLKQIKKSKPKFIEVN